VTISQVLYAQACLAESNENTKGAFGDSCDGTYPAVCGAGNDLLTCDDSNTEIHSYSKNKYAGIKITSFDSSITDCASIDEVLVCYEWWQDGGDPTECDISVDADGDNSWSNVTIACPGTSANPGITCADATSLESWECTNFFGSSGTRAQIKSEITRTSAGSADTASWDALYFDITYSTG
jgi:hypothetical protein